MNQVTHEFSQNDEIQSVSLPAFNSFIHPQYMIDSKQSEVILIQLRIEHLVSDTEESVAYKNLKNEGQTCYLDSMI